MAGLTKRQLQLEQDKLAADAEIRREQLRLEAEGRRRDQDAAAQAQAAESERKRKQQEAADAIAKSEADARVESMRAQNNPELIAAKNAAELKRQAQENEAKSAESYRRLAVQGAAVVTGVTVGHSVAHWIESRNAKNFEQKAKQLEELGTQTKDILARYEGNVEKLREPVTAPVPPATFKSLTPTQRKELQKVVAENKDPVAVKRAVDKLTLANRVVPPASAAPVIKAKLPAVVATRLKAGAEADRRALVGAVRTFDEHKLGHLKGPLGVAGAGLFLADAAFARYKANEARANGDKSAAEAWDTFGTANQVGGGSLIATRLIQRDTLNAVPAARHVTAIETAREATGLSLKPVLQRKIVDAAVKSKSLGFGLVSKSGLLKKAASFIPVVGGIFAIAAAYDTLHSLAQRSTGSAPSAEGPVPSPTSKPIGPQASLTPADLARGGQQQFEPVGGTVQIGQHIRLNANGTVSTVASHQRHVG